MRSTLAAIVAMTTLALFPPQAAAQRTAPASSLQALVNDVAAQIQLAYRQDPAERQRRHAELAAAVAAWRAGERSAANNRLLGEWLRAAIRSSMPGSTDPLPELPEFSRGPGSVGSPTAKSGRDTSLMTGNKSAGDPFGDDPLPVGNSR
jgi:hypothetical protein